MRTQFVLSVMMTVAMLGEALAAVIKVEQKVLLPDGKPAVGAKVLLRTLNEKDGTLLQERRLQTDENGLIKGEIEQGASEGDPFRPTGYLMVNMPGFPLTFQKFSELRWQNPDPLTLSPGYEISGKALTQTGTPIPKAKIALASFVSPWGSWRVNWPSAGIVTPEAMVITGEDGSYSMMVNIVERREEGSMRPLLVGSGSLDGNTLRGSMEAMALKVGQVLPPNMKREEGIRLYPCDSVRGTVVNAADQKPLAGAKVWLVAFPGGALSSELVPTTTAGDGSYEFKDVPQSFSLFSQASHPDFAGAYVMIGERRNRIGGTTAQNLTANPIAMRAWASLSGKVVDVLTGKAPFTPISVSTVYTEGYNDGSISVGRGSAGTKTKADGSFTLKLPVGPNHFYVRGPGYSERLGEHPTDLDIKPGENNGQVFSVGREGGFLVHFTTTLTKNNPDYNYDRDMDLMIRGKDGKESGTSPGEWWYWPQYKPDDTMDIRMTRTVDGINQEIFPWTKLTPWKEANGNAEHWPREIFLPQKQTVTVRGKVVAFGKNTPVGGATVTLAARPDKAVAKIAPVVSAVDGSFVFENILLPKEMVVKAVPPKETGGASVYVPGSARVGTGLLQAVVTKSDVGHQEINVEVGLKTLAPVTIQLIDNATGKPVVAGTTIQARYEKGFESLPAPANASWNDKPLSDDGAFANIPVPEGGKVSLLVPPGEVNFLIAGDYKLSPEQSKVVVPAAGLPELILKVDVNPGFLVRFIREDPALGTIRYWMEPLPRDPTFTRNQGTRYDWGQGDQKLFRYQVPKWGHKMHLNVVEQSTGKELFSGELTAEQNTGLVEIRLKKP